MDKDKISPGELTRKIMQNLLDQALLIGLTNDRVGKISDCIELTLYRNRTAAQPTAEGGRDG